jgi:hypothetical protein
LVYSLDVLLWEAKLASVVSSLLRSYYNLQKVSLGTTELRSTNIGFSAVLWLKRPELNTGLILLEVGEEVTGEF